MVSYFIVPAEITIENGEQSRNPKYVDSIQANWSGIYIEQFDVYVIMVNTASQGKMNQLKGSTGVIELNGSRQVKNLISQVLSIGQIPDDISEIDFLGKKENPHFRKEDLFVREG